MTSSSPLALFSSLDQKPGMPFLGRLSPGEGDRRLGQKHISITCSANPLSSRLAQFLENHKCSVNAGSVGAVLWYWGVFIKGRAQVTREADHCDSLPRVPLDKLGLRGRTISKDTAKLCSLLSSISPGDPRDKAAQGQWALVG